MKKITLIIFIIFAFALQSNAQFYNGLQMTFGKNRVQYQSFNWLFYRYEAYDIYFYDNGAKLAEFAGEYVEEVLPEMEKFFGYKLQKRLIFIIYNKQTDFKQSNIGLESGNVEFNIGGATQINDNKIFLFYERDHDEFKTEIRRIIAKVIVDEMLFGSALKDKVTNSTLITLPEWYEKGLIEYATSKWNFEIENSVKDAILSDKYKNFNHLSGDDASNLGHSIWYYIAETYGEDVISNIIYFTRINKNANSGFSYVTGMSIRQLKPDWHEFFVLKFEKEEQNKNLPENKIIKKWVNKKTVYQQVKLNPKKQQLAYVTNTMGKYKIFIYDLETQEKKRVFKEGQKLEQITDFSYPLIAWHPTGTVMSFISEDEGDVYLNQYTLETEVLKRGKLIKITKVTDFSYSHNGRFIVLSAVRDGYTDIFVYSLGSGSLKQITNDLADDINPHFVEKSSKIIFSSNRSSDTLKVEKKYKDHAKVDNFYDLFIYNLKDKNPVLQRITNTPYINETQAIEIDKNKYLFLSDQSGIINRHIATYDSTISHIDTTVHYRYFSTSYPLTNYSRNIVSYDVNVRTKKIIELIFTENKYYMFLSDFKIDKNPDLIKNYKQSASRKQLTQRLSIADSILLVRKQKDILEQQIIDSLDVELPEEYTNPDSILIDIGNYKFEIEKDTIYRLYYLKHIKNLEPKNIKPINNPKWIYYPTFYMDDVMGQVDFGMLNQSYQVFDGGPYYFNPGMNIFFKMGVDELFEDYKIMGGFKVGLDFNTFEYLASIEDLSKRLDKQLVYHRQSYKKIPDDTPGQDIETKIVTNELMYILRYPFNQTTSVKATLNTRYDKNYYLSTGWNTLVSELEFNIFTSLKLEYIFDNTRSLGTNLYDGVRYKIFGEFHQKTHGNFDHIGILGADFRYYKQIHRNLIFASRFAASTSFGSGKLIYYLGGVDNWYSLAAALGEGGNFNEEVEMNHEENYIYQAVATNMRGYSQNIRNGNSFAVINNEIRFPIIKYFANQPISSDFFNNFQIVGFFDVGSAWSGLSPFDEQNAYNQTIVENGPVTITIDVDRVPFVAGYGWGVRSKLFGYFFRLDWAWGIEGYHTHPRKFYFSLNLDF